MAEALEFDPTSEDAANSPLAVWNTGGYHVESHAYPAPPQSVQWASSVDTEGSVAASRKHENRTISLTIICDTAAALRSLQAKAGKIAREGGTLKYTLPNSEVIVFDLLATDTFDPVFDIAYHLNAGALCTVTLVFSAKPYGRGTEVDLGDNTETTLPVLVFTEATVAGDMPALGRLVIDNDVANTQRVFRWGIQSRYYSSASTAALFYEAESCAGANPTPLAGASGGATGTSLYSTLPVTGGWASTINVGASATAQTHIGTYRVFVRAWAPAANSGIVSLRLTWQPAIGRAQISNESVALTTAAGAAYEDVWLMADLGMVALPKAVSGTQGWLGTIEGTSTVLNDDIYLDWVALIPVDEGSGEHVDPTSLIAQFASSGTVQVRYDGVLASSSGGYLSPLSVYEGDYLLVPPSGAEARTLRVIVKLARGDTTNTRSAVVLDSSIDDLSARLFVTPRYLVVPSP